MVFGVLYVCFGSKNGSSVCSEMETGEESRSEGRSWVRRAECLSSVVTMQNNAEAWVSKRKELVCPKQLFKFKKKVLLWVGS